MTFEEELNVLSSECKRLIRCGQISMYSESLKKLADLFRRNNHVVGWLKMLSVSFYIDLSGFSRAPYIDRELAEQIRAAVSLKEIDVCEFERLYFSWVQPDMITQYALSVKDSWYLMRLCIEGKVEQAEYILAKI